MSRELSNLFSKKISKDVFSKIKISLLVRKKLNLGLLEKLKNQRLLIIEPLSLKKTAYFVQEFLVLSKITNVYVENTKE